MLKFYRKRTGGGGTGRPRSHSTLTLHRTTSIPEIETSDSPCTSSPEPEIVSRSRSHTITGGEILSSKSKSKSDGNLLLPFDAYLSGAREREGDLMTFSSPRHFQRRGGVVGDIDVSSIQRPGEDGECVRVLVEEGRGGRLVNEIILAEEKKPLREMLDYLFIKNDLEVDWAPPTHHITVSMRNGTRTTPDLDLPTQHFAGCQLEIRPVAMDTRREKEGENLSFTTLQSCLSYFSAHGLVELPLSGSQVEGEEYHLPRVQPLDNIPGKWDDLPIKLEYKQHLSSKQLSQQQAVWELIQTEHSHLKQLEIVINLFMQSLELIRRANVLSHDKYHNVFGGYMEELYTVHDQFWSWTLWPCLEQVYLTGKPLDIGEIIRRFPGFSTQFEIYEQHCALDAVNIRNLNKAMKDHDFRTYLEWCEAHSQCQRRKLKDFLVIPMQRLTRYPLLFNAILKETTDSTEYEPLEKIWYEVDCFVQSVNMVLVVQSETERVRDAMSRIVSYTAVDLPGEFKELMQPYTHLDLLAPMPDVEIDKPRVLMLEGSLKFRDHSSKMVAHIFLFTDMLLITKPRRGGDKYSIARPPFKISSLVLHPLEPGSFLVLVLTPYRVLTSWFSLKALSESVAQEWMDTISTAQHCYSEAVEKKAHHWKLLQNLKSERILNGIDNKPVELSQSVGSVNSHRSRHSLSRGSLTTSNDSLDHSPHTSPYRHQANFLFEQHSRVHPISRSRSADIRHMRVFSNPSLNQSSDCATGWPSSVSGVPPWLERTSSLKTLFERPESNFSSPSSSTNQLLAPLQAVTFPRSRSQSMEYNVSKLNTSDLLRNNSSVSDSSGSDVNIHEEPIRHLSFPLPDVAAGFGKWQSTDGNFSRLQRQSPVEEGIEVEGEGEGEGEGEVEVEGEGEGEGEGVRGEEMLATEIDLQSFPGLADDCNIVMVTPPSPRLTLTRSPAHFTVDRAGGGTQQSPAHKKSCDSSETSPEHSPAHKKPLSSSSTRQSKQQKDADGSPTHKQKSPTHKQQSPAHKKRRHTADEITTKPSHTHTRGPPGFRGLRLLAESTMATCMTPLSIRDTLVEPEEQPDKLVTEEGEEFSCLPRHTVIPTFCASGSDSDSVSSPLTTCLVDCLQDAQLGGRDEPSVTVGSCRDSNLKSDTTSVHTAKLPEAQSSTKRGVEAVEKEEGGRTDLPASYSGEVVPASNTSKPKPPPVAPRKTSGGKGTQLLSSPVRLQHSPAVPREQESREEGQRSENEMPSSAPGRRGSRTLGVGRRVNEDSLQHSSSPGASSTVVTAAVQEMENLHSSTADHPASKPKVAFSEVVHYSPEHAASGLHPPHPSSPPPPTTTPESMKPPGHHGKREREDSEMEIVPKPSEHPLPTLTAQPKLPRHDNSSRSTRGISPPQKRSVKELSNLFERKSDGKRLSAPSLSFLSKSTSTQGLNHISWGTHDGGKRENGLSVNENGRGCGIRKSVSTSNLNHPVEERKSEAKLSPVEERKSEAKLRPVEGRKSEAKLCPVEGRKSEAKLNRPVEGRKSEANLNRPVEERKSEAKLRTVEERKSEAKLRPVEGRKSEAKLNRPVEGRKSEAKLRPVEGRKSEAKLNRPVEGRKSEAKLRPVEERKSEAKLRPVEGRKSEARKYELNDSLHDTKVASRGADKEVKGHNSEPDRDLGKDRETKLKIAVSVKIAASPLSEPPARNHTTDTPADSLPGRPDSEQSSWKSDRQKLPAKKPDGELGAAGGSAGLVAGTSPPQRVRGGRSPEATSKLEQQILNDGQSVPKPDHDSVKSGPLLTAVNHNRPSKTTIESSPSNTVTSRPLTSRPLISRPLTSRPLTSRPLTSRPLKGILKNKKALHSSSLSNPDLLSQDRTPSPTHSQKLVLRAGGSSEPNLRAKSHTHNPIGHTHNPIGQLKKTLCHPIEEQWGETSERGEVKLEVAGRDGERGSGAENEGDKDGKKTRGGGGGGRGDRAIKRSLGRYVTKNDRPHSHNASSISSSNVIGSNKTFSALSKFHSSPALPLVTSHTHSSPTVAKHQHSFSLSDSVPEEPSLLSCSAPPSHLYQRSPLEWEHFGLSWKQPSPVLRRKKVWNGDQPAAVVQSGFHIHHGNASGSDTTNHHRENLKQSMC